MSTCIYYDLEVIEVEDVARAQLAAGVGAVEVAPSGAHAPPLLRELLQRVDGPRVSVNQDRTMAWVERLRRGLERTDLSGWSRRGANLFEVGRYEFFQGVLEWEHRWWVASEIRRRWAPKQLLWIARPKTGNDNRDLLALARALQATGLQTGYVATAPRRLHLDLLSDVKERLWTIRDRLPSLRHGTRPAATRSRIIFTDYFANNLKSLYPVASQLEDRGGSVAWLAGRQEVQTSLSKRGIRSHLIDDFVSLRSVVNSRLTLSESARARRALASLGDDVPPWLARIAGRSLLRASATAAFWIEAYHSAFALLRPEVVVSGVSMGTMGRAAASQVSGLGGRSVHLQHGMYPDRLVYSFYLHDLKLVWGAYDRKGLLKFGHDPDSVFVTGSPLYDASSPKQVSFSPGPQLRVAYLPTLSSAITLSTAEEMMRAVASAARALGAVLSVKPHPGDRSQVSESVLRDFPEFRLVRDQDAGDVIRANDVVIVVISSVGNEACLAGRPLITFNMEATGWEDHTEYARYGAALSVSRPEDMLGALVRVRDDASLRERLAAGRRALIEDMLNGARGDAARNAADRIVACLKENHAHV